MTFKLGELVTNNPLLRRWHQERELKKAQRILKRAKAKAKANRDKLVTQLAQMSPDDQRRHRLPLMDASSRCCADRCGG